MKRKTTQAERQRQLREQRKAAGQIRVEVWIPAEHRERHAAYVRRLNRS